MQQRKKCDKCGCINKADATQCIECGHRLSITPVTLPSKTVDSPPIKKPDDNRPTLRSNSWRKAIIASMVILLIALPILYYVYQILSQPSMLKLPDGLGVVKAPNGVNVGVNDGTYEPFDIGSLRTNSNLKLQAAQALRDGDSQRALALWSQSLSGPDTNDAEVKIYLQNQHTSAFNHVTLIVGLDLTPSSPNDTYKNNPNISQQSVLQGAYIAQKEFNSQHTNIKMRLLLANTGGDPSYIPLVIQQLASIIKKDPTVVGILGWQTSSRTVNVLDALQKAHATIPILSESTTADDLTGTSPHFFRIAPPNNLMAPTLLKIADDRLHATQAIVLRDTSNAYSQNVAQDFESQFRQAHSSPNALIDEPFTAGKTTTAQFSASLKQALNYVSDTTHVVIFFAAAFPSDEKPFQDALVGDYSKLPIISGTTGYYNITKNVYGRWYFTSFAFHDEWTILTGKDNPFFVTYSKEFDMGPSRPRDYGYTLPDDIAIVSYDAASVLAHGIDMAISNSKGANAITPQDLENALSNITGAQAFQGVSGLIDFNAQHDSTDKAFVVLQVDNNGFLKFLCVQGHFSANSDNSPSQCDTYFHDSSTT